MRKRKNKQANKQAHSMYVRIKHCDEGKRRAKASKTKPQQKKNVVARVQSNPKFDTFRFRAKPHHDRQCQAKPSQKRLGKAIPETNSSEFIYTK